MDFEILIDETFARIVADKSLTPVNNKHVLSIVNDFEDGQWRFKKFDSFIWDNITQTSLSNNEREKLVNLSDSLLTAAAQNLRLTDKEKDISKGSELAEIALYGIMKHHYKALPVVPKIFYKQNAQDNAKGADSVHIVIEGENDFSLWLGEAKFYNGIENARLDKIVQSVLASIQTDKLKKENVIITSVSDIDGLVPNEALLKKIKLALSPQESIDSIKSKLHIPILLLHECEITKGATAATGQYKEDVLKYHIERAEAYFKKQIEKLNAVYMYADITFHVILFPVPDKEPIIKRFVDKATVYKV